MSKIFELDQNTIEKIAAGEVIERPESIIKEAVENSIDANSTSIQIEIKSGGKDYIRVTDNGDGISYDDLDLVFKKHYTSKIKDFNDIYNLYSRGFRGEALNSIASVSNASIISREKNSDIAYQIDYKFGDFVDKTISVSNKGTTLIVNSLFENMPVRKKLLSSNRTEENRIRSLVERFAIGFPYISFKFFSNSRLLINTSGSGDLKTAIFEVYGRNIVKDLIKIESDEIYGYISNINLFSNNYNTQMFFVNDRIVYNEELNKAVESQYFGKIPNNKKPMFFIFVKLDSDKVDVNIHPSKKYIKILFSDELIADIKNIVSVNLLKNQVYVFAKENDNEIEIKPYYQNYENDAIRLESENFSIVADTNENYDNNNDIVFNDESYIQNELNIEVPNIVIDEKDAASEDEEFKLNIIFPDNKIEKFNNILGVLFKKYMILENRPNNLVLLVDLKLANSRIFFDLYTKNIDDNNVAIQSLLEPIIYNFNYRESEFVNNNIDAIVKTGFDLTAINDDTFVLRGIPMIISDYFKKDDFLDIINNISKDKSLLIPNIINRVSLISYNADSFFNNNISRNILESLLVSSNPYTAPNGKAIFKILSQDEFLKRFKYE